jgi:isocitrate/isopropylmalate dehydrogenase
MVCESCSSKKLVIENEANSSNSPKPDEKSSVSAKRSTEKQLQRVCDNCFLIAQKKEELKVEVIQKQQKQNELLMKSSWLSTSSTLADIYFLDGSKKKKKKNYFDNFIFKNISTF